MSIQIGGVDILKQGLDTEFRLGVLELILEDIINTNPNLNKPAQSELQSIREKIVRQLKEKYPDSGIELTK